MGRSTDLDRSNGCGVDGNLRLALRRRMTHLGVVEAGEIELITSPSCRLAYHPRMITTESVNPKNSTERHRLAGRIGVSGNSFSGFEAWAVASGFVSKPGIGSEWVAKVPVLFGSSKRNCASNALNR